MQGYIALAIVGKAAYASRTHKTDPSKPQDYMTDFEQQGLAIAMKAFAEGDLDQARNMIEAAQVSSRTTAALKTCWVPCMHGWAKRKKPTTFGRRHC